MALIVVMAATIALPAAAQPVASVQVSAGSISWSPSVDYERMVLTVSGQGHHYKRAFDSGDAVTFAIVQEVGLLPDGNYTWELVAEPRGGRDRDEDAGAPLPRMAQSGHFNIQRGSLARPNEGEAAGLAVSQERTAGPAAGESNPFQEDQVILDDLIVDGSACIGQDCVNGESFGFDTIRLKENNLRIKFQDTSSTSSFPSRDWQITANDSSNGGANKFSIDDIDGGRTPFTIEASAPSNSLYVDDGGRIGFGTATPVVELDVRDGDTPTLRLEQDGSSGFTPQTWDVAGNEANFFIRDATNGSQLPFKIKPGADSNSLVIAADNDIGIGTDSPGSLPTQSARQAALHVRRTNGNGAILVEEAGSTEATRTLLELANNGQPRFDFTDTSADGDNWRLINNNSGFAIIKGGAGATFFQISDNGDIEAPTGTVVHTSSREIKRDIELVDSRQVLETVSNLPLATWRYDRGNNGEALHLGPMAEDFYAAFGLGETDTHIAVSDTSGVALAAIQGLNEVVQERNTEISALRTENVELRDRLERLEAAVERLSSDLH